MKTCKLINNTRRYNNLNPKSKTLADLKPKTFLNKSLIKEIKIRNLRFYENNTISGGTLENHTIQDFYKLKEAGINSIISFHSEASKKYEKKCKKAGLKYYNFPIEHSYTTSHQKKNDPLIVSETFIENLKSFMKIYNKGNVYMGCNYGIDRTNLALTFNYLLNSKTKTPPKILSWDEYKPKNILNRTIKFTKKRIKKFTEIQKRILKLPKDLHDFIYPKINKLVHFNNLK